MNTSYIDLYEILDVFEDNAYQKIMMGAPYNNPEEIVIINCLKNNNSWAKKIFENAKNTLQNLIHSEILPDSLVLVTEYQEGITIDEYTMSIKDDNRRYYLAKNYLRSIATYGTFSPYMQTILVDQNQIIIQDNNLLMNSVMIIDQQIENNLPFASVIEKVKSTLETIFYTGQPSFDENENNRIQAFLVTLNPNRNEYHCLADIVVAFENAFALSSNTPVKQDAIQEQQLNEDTVVATAIATNGLEHINSTNNTTSKMTVENINNDIPQEPQAEELSGLDALAGVGIGVAAGVAATDAAVNTSAASNANTINQKEIELDGLTVVNEMFDEPQSQTEENYKDKDKNKKQWGLLLILLLLLAALGYLAYTRFYNPEKDMLPKAAFVRTVNDDKQYFQNNSVAFGKDNQVVSSEWTVYTIADDGSEKRIKTYNKRDLNLFIKTPGTYKTELRVQDSKGQWSEVVSEEFVLEASALDPNTDNSEFASATEKLDSLNISFDTDNILFAEDIFRSGNRSLHFDLDKGDGTITINDIFTDSSAILSAWAYSDSTEPIVLNITGYDNGKKVFTHKKKHVFKAANTWEMIEMKLPNKSAYKLVITISGKGQLWIDDIDINTFK